MFCGVSFHYSWHFNRNYQGTCFWKWQNISVCQNCNKVYSDDKEHITDGDNDDEMPVLTSSGKEMPVLSLMGTTDHNNNSKIATTENQEMFNNSSHYDNIFDFLSTLNPILKRSTPTVVSHGACEVDSLPRHGKKTLNPTLKRSTLTVASHGEVDSLPRHKGKTLTPILKRSTPTVTSHGEVDSLPRHGGKTLNPTLKRSTPTVAPHGEVDDSLTRHEGKTLKSGRWQIVTEVSKERPHQCQICKACFKTRQTLQKHHLIHTGEKPFRCQFCDANFRQSSQVKRHIKRVHSGINLDLKTYK